MIPTWIRRGLVVVSLIVTCTATNAATVDGATFDLTGTYVHKKGRYHLSGDFLGNLLTSPRIVRPYELDFEVKLRGRKVLDLDLPLTGRSGALLSIDQILEGKARGGVGVARLLGDLSHRKSGSGLAGDVDLKLGKKASRLLRSACLSRFASGKRCRGRGGFEVALGLTYSAPAAPLDLVEETQRAEQQPAPVPLPAGLPLLAAGLAGLAALRARSSRRVSPS